MIIDSQESYSESIDKLYENLEEARGSIWVDSDGERITMLADFIEIFILPVLKIVLQENTSLKNRLNGFSLKEVKIV